jgi:hypothetical protein
MGGLALLLSLLSLLSAPALADEEQCNEEEERAQPIVPPLPVDAAVASVLKDLRSRAATCTPQSVSPPR